MKDGDIPGGGKSSPKLVSTLLARSDNDVGRSRVSSREWRGNFFPQVSEMMLGRGGCFRLLHIIKSIMLFLFLPLIGS